MIDHERESEPYFQQDLQLGEGLIQGEPTTIRARLHSSEEDYNGRDELLVKVARTGRRLYLHARPYILEPEIRLTVALDPIPSGTDRVGEVLSSDWEGMRHTQIGQAQAWIYPTERSAVLWECYLFGWCRQDSPLADPTLATPCSGFERVVVEQLPQLERIVTPSSEDIYERSLWQDFLKAHGYRPFSERAFAKELAEP